MEGLRVQGFGVLGFGASLGPDTEDITLSLVTRCNVPGISVPINIQLLWPLQQGFWFRFQVWFRKVFC